MTLTTRLWEGDSFLSRVSRALLTPASVVFATAMGLRNAFYFLGVLKTHTTRIPVVSIGNLSVGGTGKTPVAAWMGAELTRRGMRPALVMRGYGGGDEARVHALLNPDIPVIVNPDRVEGVREAGRGGANIVVLDDGFQHLRVARLEDVVLVSVDRWREPLQVLPAGPWREGLGAFRRASLLIVTRKAADFQSADSLLRRLLPLTRTGSGAVAALQSNEVRNVATGEIRAMTGLQRAPVLAIAGIGDPVSFERQLRAAGLDVTMRVFPDHHVYRAEEVERLAREGSAYAHVICTLKDAVKLGQLWPREGPSLWYVSLRCRIESGEADVAAMLDRLVARHLRTQRGAD